MVKSRETGVAGELIHYKKDSFPACFAWQLTIRYVRHFCLTVARQSLDTLAELCISRRIFYKNC